MFPTVQKNILQPEVIKTKCKQSKCNHSSLILSRCSTAQL